MNNKVNSVKALFVVGKNISSNIRIQISKAEYSSFKSNKSGDVTKEVFFLFFFSIFPPTGILDTTRFSSCP